MAQGTGVVGRIAPSPTGWLHLGHARTFLLAWWSARSQNGKIVLRLEDLDRERCRPAFVDGCLRDLEWLGMDWDGEAYQQSDGCERILESARRLERLGLAYPCVCSRSDIRGSVQAPHQGEHEYVYDGRCRGRYPSRQAALAATGQQAALRFRVPEGKIVVWDAIGGPVWCDVAREVGDFPIVRRDGTPAYQLAVVVDDAWQEVTEVVRGHDLSSSAGRQQLLQAALGLSTPNWAHVPLVLDLEGRRFAKRAGDLSLRALREARVDPRALVGWIAQVSGWPDAEPAHPYDLVESFQIGRVPTKPVRIDPRQLELLWERH